MNNCPNILFEGMGLLLLTLDLVKFHKNQKSDSKTAHHYFSLAKALFEQLKNDFPDFKEFQDNYARILKDMKD